MMTPAFSRSEKHLNLAGSKAEGTHESHVIEPAFDVCPSLQRMHWYNRGIPQDGENVLAGQGLGLTVIGGQ